MANKIATDSAVYGGYWTPALPHNTAQCGSFVTLEMPVMQSRGQRLTRLRGQLSMSTNPYTITSVLVLTSWNSPPAQSTPLTTELNTTNGLGKPYVGTESAGIRTSSLSLSTRDYYNITSPATPPANYIPPYVHPLASVTTTTTSSTETSVSFDQTFDIYLTGEALALALIVTNPENGDLAAGVIFVSFSVIAEFSPASGQATTLS